MAQKAIREYDAKQLLSTHWSTYFSSLTYSCESVLISNAEELLTLSTQTDWLTKKNLVVKPDMLFGKRGLNNLVLYKDNEPGDITLQTAATWVKEQINAEQQVFFSFDGDSPTGTPVTGNLTHFIVEPFIRHTDEQEFYIAASTDGDADILYLSASGGMHIEEQWDAVVSELRFSVTATDEEIEAAITKQVRELVSEEYQQSFTTFAIGFFQFFKDCHFAYLEINPFVLEGDTVHLLDAVARLDDTASHLMNARWNAIDFPTPFGFQETIPEIQAIEKMDASSGASLKLTVLNPTGRIWTLVAGGGGSVVYADTIADLAGAEELANYGEYSGGPTTTETQHYAETILDLMTREADPKGRRKILIIGGAIANFTDIAKTFTGIIAALTNYAEKLQRIGVDIYVRRGGPNYKKGLADMKAAADRLQLPIEVHGPETHITDIVRIALEK